MLRITTQFGSGQTPPGTPQGEPQGGVLQQLCDVLLRPDCYEVLECDGELFIRYAEPKEGRGAARLRKGPRAQQERK